MDNNSMSRGLSLIGQTFSGSSKAVEEVFIRGKNIDLPEGIELYVQTKEPVVVYGLRQKGSYKDTVVTTPTPIIIEKPSTETVTVDKPTNEPATADKPATEPATVDAPKTETPAEEQSDLRLAEDERGDVVKDTKPAPTEDPKVEPRPDEGKTLEGNDGEIIEIIDEE